MGDRLKKVFIINGSPTSGKNTFVDMVGKYIPVAHYSYVDMTRCALDYIGIDYKNKSDKARRLIESVNNSLEEYCDAPFTDICDITNDFLEDYLVADILFIDIRKPSLIKRYVDKYKGTGTILMVSNVPISNATESDSLVENYEYDIKIDNTGTLAQLQEQAEKFAKIIAERFDDVEEVEE